MRLLLTAALLTSSVPGLFAAGIASDLDPSQIDGVIAKFAAKEAEFAKARSNYTYRQTAKIEELDPDGREIQGQYMIVSDIIFSPEGKRSERIVRAPVSTLHILLTPEDEQDLRDIQPFVLTTSEIPNYLIRYLGREQLDEIGCYAFAVKPKKLEPGKRYFEGIVWVDDKDMQVVKSYGRGVGKVDKENLFPKFETYREQIDGKYWFPTYTIANDTLYFKDNPQRIRMTVKYQDYKQFKSDVNIRYSDEAVPSPRSNPAPSQDKK